ncbi:collagen alpha-1(XIV) chain-like [Lethenteron reissneri]|uniref:collagen alpha-1(XIV) chain-like n=1 Tax=Lethenteron reissneri TaxID=7753 RepID=UPI002AB780D5|nr:collagen alpha-1(XIV) chain-like [Lethenteron reissneri]
MALPWARVLCCVGLSLLACVSAQEVCRSVQVADVAFLIDGSWSIGRSNFEEVKAFIEGIVGAFTGSTLGTAGIRVAVAQFSDDPRMEFRLMDFTTSWEEVKSAVRALPYKGGNTRTGEGLKFVADTIFAPSTLRADVPKVVIVITDGKSQDSVENPSNRLKSRGVTVYAIGIKNADKEELDIISSQPSEQHSLYIDEFKLLRSVLPKITRRVCHVLAGLPFQPELLPTAALGVQDLVALPRGPSALHVSWTEPAPGDVVIGYRVLYVLLDAAGQPIASEQGEVAVRSGETTVSLSDLRPSSDYSVTVVTQYEGHQGQPITATARTGDLSVQTRIRVLDEGLYSLRVTWDPPASPVQGYRLTNSPRDSRLGPSQEMNLAPGATSHLLDDLRPDTEYVVSLYALATSGNHEAALTASGRTLRLEGVRRLLLQNVTTNSMRAVWEPPRGATGYRLTWGATEGGDRQSVTVDGSYSTFLLPGMSTGSEYQVSINPVYGSVEGPVVTASATTLSSGVVQDLRVTRVTSSSLRLAWTSLPGATGYSLVWGPTNGGQAGRRRSQQVVLPGTASSHELLGLSRDTEYALTLHATFGETQGPGSPTTARTVTADDAEASFPLSVSDLRVLEVKRSSVRIGWSGVSRSTGYRITWGPASGGAELVRMVRPKVTSYAIEGLQEATAYTVGVTAMAGRREGALVTITITTGTGDRLDVPSQGSDVGSVRNLRIVDSGSQYLRVSWTRLAQASGYRLSWRITDGGPESSRMLRPDATTFVVDGLQQGTTYSLSLVALAGAREGAAATLIARTRGGGGEAGGDAEFLGVQGFRVSDTSDGVLTLTWEPQPRASQYLLTWASDAGEQFRASLEPSVTMHKVTGLLGGRVYTFTILPMFSTRHGPSSTLTQRTEGLQVVVGPPIFEDDDSGFWEACLGLQADIVFLVDGSAAVGVGNFERVREFLARMVSLFPRIGPNGTQVAVAQFSDDVTVEFNLNEYRDRGLLDQAIRALLHAGGPGVRCW